VEDKIVVPIKQEPHESQEPQEERKEQELPIELPQDELVPEVHNSVSIEELVKEEPVILETVDEPTSVDTESPSLEQIAMSNEDIPEVPVDISYNLGNPEKIESDGHDTILENAPTEVETSETEQSLGEQLEIMETPFDSTSNEMEEVSFPMDNLNNAEPFHLKERNDIYYEMYYEARRKAKMAKEMALNCYLEAKNIKNTYMLNDLPESDSDENISEP